MTTHVEHIDINDNNWGDVVTKINAMIDLIPDDFVTSVAVDVPAGFTTTGNPITGSGSININYASGYQGYTTAEANKLAGLHSNYVSSIGVTVPTGFSVGNSPITTSGNIAINYAAGYQGYTTAEANKLAGIAAGAQVNTVTSVAGKTGAVTVSKSDVGLSNVDNTSDANKPISTATQSALDSAPRVPVSGSAVTVDFNTLLTPGWHSSIVRGDGANGWGTNDYGYLLTLKHTAGYTQLAIPYSTTGKIRYRTHTGAVWSAWTSIGSMAARDVFISSSDPSGGSNGDIWYQV